VWKLFLVCLICSVAVVLGSALLGERPALVEQGVDWVTSLGSGEPASVLVLLVTDRSGLAGLASKPTLTPGEVIALLNGSVSGVRL